MLELGTLDNPRPFCIADIAVAVADFYHVGVGDLRGQCRRRDIARPRQVAYYLCRKYAMRTLDDIGGFFGGRDHATVIHGVGLVEDAVSKPESLLARQVEMLSRSLQHRHRVGAVA